jgi:PAS domain S-box-containing protein
MADQDFYQEVIKEVMSCPDISVAVDDKIKYIAVNEAACRHLSIKPDDLLGKSALDLYPEIIASKNHRNILKALSGHSIEGELIESRAGALLLTSYRPVIMDEQVKAIILTGILQKK